MKQVTRGSDASPRVGMKRVFGPVLDAIARVTGRKQEQPPPLAESAHRNTRRRKEKLPLQRTEPVRAPEKPRESKYTVLESIRSKPEGERLGLVKKLLAGKKEMAREGALACLLLDADSEAIPLLRQLIRSKDKLILENRSSLIVKLVQIGDLDDATLALAKPLITDLKNIYWCRILPVLAESEDPRIARFLLETAVEQRDKQIKAELEYTAQRVLGNISRRRHTEELLASVSK